MEAWFIEAPGKAAKLEATLRRLGHDVVVQATKGHFMALPTDLSPLGIDAGFHEYARAPTDPILYARIRDVARQASSVVVATDGDAEGEAIAWDVAQAIVDLHPEPVRVRLSGMDDDSIRESIAAGGTVREADAIPGRTRAIVDRIIGATFAGQGIAVGRVGSAMLGLVSRAKPSVFRLTLVAPAKDGGRPWRAECPVKAPLTPQDAEALAALSLPALDFQSGRTRTAVPAHMGDIMVRAGEKLGLSPAETARSMQRSYENGKLSYPRSGSRAVSRATARRLRKMMVGEGFVFEDRLVANRPAEEAHDAPHPLGPVSLGLDPRQLGADEGVRTMIARDLVRSGQTVTSELAATRTLRSFLSQKGFSDAVCEMVAQLPWGRERGPAAPGGDNWSESRLVKRRADVVLLEACVEAGLGRPSTWANHVERFMARGLVDDQLGLTAKGQDWLNRTPRQLLDPNLSAAIERACERGHPRMNEVTVPAWEFLAERIVSVLPEPVRAPMMAAVTATAPQQRMDWNAEARRAEALRATAEGGGEAASYLADLTSRTLAPVLQPED